MNTFERDRISLCRAYGYVYADTPQQRGAVAPCGHDVSIRDKGFPVGQQGGHSPRMGLQSAHLRAKAKFNTQALRLFGERQAKSMGIACLVPLVVNCAGQLLRDGRQRRLEVDHVGY